MGGFVKKLKNEISWSMDKPALPKQFDSAERVTGRLLRLRSGKAAGITRLRRRPRVLLVDECLWRVTLRSLRLRQGFVGQVGVGGLASAGYARRKLGGGATAFSRGAPLFKNASNPS
jgi:hypothetical protein